MNSSDPKCKRCLLSDLAEKDRQELWKYIDVLKPEDRAKAWVEEKRLEICRSCDRLENATCLACGCYVEVRAALKDGSCPRKKWI